MKKTIILVCFILFSYFLFGQELDCQIQINHSKLQGTVNDKLFQNMQQQLYEFINNTTWTRHVYLREERIECNIAITINSQVASDEFKAQIQVSSSRPVYGTSYRSPIFNHIDNDFQFKYVEMQAMDFSINTFSSNLTSVIAYYCYLIIGFDYDTFSSNGGNPYFQLAEKIVQNSQSAVESGWKAYENLKNRYWLVENLLNDQYSSLRDFNYIYHRQGMDKLAEKPADSRSALESAIENFKIVNRKRPNSFLLSIYTTTKRDEIINIFSEAFPDEKSRVYNIMKEVDPADITKYDKMMKDQNQ